MFSQMLEWLASLSVVSHCSDSLVEEAVGEKRAAISLVETEEEGYLASEVTFFF